jgi:hypothetical protein
MRQGVGCHFRPTYQLLVVIVVVAIWIVINRFDVAFFISLDVDDLSLGMLCLPLQLNLLRGFGFKVHCSYTSFPQSKS